MWLYLIDKLGEGRIMWLYLIDKLGEGRIMWLYLTARLGEGRIMWLYLIDKLGEGRIMWLYLTARLGEGRIMWLYLTARLGEGRIMWLNVALPHSQAVGRSHNVALPHSQAVGRSHNVALPHSQAARLSSFSTDSQEVLAFKSHDIFFYSFNLCRETLMLSLVSDSTQTAFFVVLAGSTGGPNFLFNLLLLFFFVFVVVVVVVVVVYCHNHTAYNTTQDITPFPRQATASRQEQIFLILHSIITSQLVRRIYQKNLYVSTDFSRVPTLQADRLIETEVDWFPKTRTR